MRAHGCRTLLDSGDLEGALGVALEAWRSSRAPDVADVIDALDARARATRPDPFAKVRSKDDLQSAWLAAAAATSHVTTGWLAATFLRMLPVAADHFGILRPDYGAEKHAALLARLAAFGPLLPDPRVARALLDALVAAPFRVWDARAAALVYGPVMDALVEAGDRRAIPTLEALVRTPRAKTAMVRSFLVERLPAIVERLRAIPVEPLGDDERSAWRALAPQAAEEHHWSSEEDGHSLLRRVREAPDDQDARLVYADWLHERGDPLGEFIVIQQRVASGQATPKEERRAGSLLRAHRDAWLGPLALVLVNVVFERGFLARAALAQNAAAAEAGWKEAAEDERLATLRELHQGRGNLDHYRSFVLSPFTRALTSIDVPTPAFLEDILRGPPRVLSTLSFRRRPRRKLLDKLARSAALPSLSTVAVALRQVEFEVFFTDLAASGVLDRLAELRVPMFAYDQPPHEVLRAWPHMPPTLVRLVVDDYNGGGHAIERHGDRVVVTIQGRAVRSVPSTLPALPPGIDEVRVVLAPEERMTAEMRPEIEAAVAARVGARIVLQP